MKVKATLEHLNGDLEVNFAIVSNKEDNNEAVRILFGEDDVYDESFWS